VAGSFEPDHILSGASPRLAERYYLFVPTGDSSWLALAIGIGIVAGLRSMTAPAAVSWAARVRWLHLEGTSLAFVGSWPAAVLFTVLALAELVADKLPTTPNRTNPGPLAGRIVLGGFAAACLTVAGGHSWLPGALAGGLGALIGAFGGYHLRKRLVIRFGVRDLEVALFEDVLAVGLAWFLVSR
jgi:uncharacterized membrane protein